MTGPAGRASVEIVADLKNLAAQVERDANAALRGVDLNLDPISKQISRGVEKGVGESAGAFNDLDDKARAAFRDLDEIAGRAFQVLGADATQAAEAVADRLRIGVQGAGEALAHEMETALPGAVRAGQVLGDATAIAVGSALDEGTNGVGAEAVRDITTSIIAGLAEARPALEAAGRQMGGAVADGIGSSSAKVRRSAGLLAGVARTGLITGIGAIATGLTALTGLGLKSAGELEQTQISLESLTGSAKAGQKVFKDLQKFSALTPFEFPDVTPVAQQFLAFSHSVGLGQDQLIPFLTTLGNVASVTGVGAEGMQRVTLALGQMASAGKVTVGDVRQISTNLPGFSGVAAIAAARGTSTAQAMEDISHGTISAQEGIKDLLAGMAKFPGAAGAMEKQSTTLLGVLSTFKDVSRQALSDSFAPVIPQIKDSLAAITPVVGEAFKTLAPALGQVVSQLLPFLSSLLQGLVPILAPILSGFAEGLASLGPALQPIGIALGQLFAAVSPVLGPLGEFAAVFLESLTPAITSLTPLLEGLAATFTQILPPLAPIITQIASAVGAVLVPIMSVLGDLLIQLAPVIASIVKIFGEAFAPILAALGPVIGQLVNALLPLLPAVLALAPPIIDILVALTPLFQLMAQLITVVVAIAAPLIQLASILLEFLASKAVAPLLELVAQALVFLLRPLDKLIPMAQAFANWLNNIDWGKTAAAIGGAFVTAWHAVLKFFDNVGSFFAELPGRIGKFFADLGATIGRGVMAALTAIGHFFASLPGLALAGLEALPGLLLGLLKTMFDLALKGIGVGIGLILAAIIELPRRIWAGLQALPTLVHDIFFATLHGAIDTVTAGINAIVAFVGSLWSKWWQGLQLLPGLLRNALSNALSSASGAASSGIDRIVGFVTSLPGRAVDALKSLGGMLRNAFVGAFNHAKEGARIAIDAIVNLVKGLPGRLTALGGALLNAGKSLIHHFLDGLRIVGGFLTDVGGDIVNAIKSGLNHVIGKINEGIAAVDAKLPFSLPRIPSLAVGGLTTSGTLAQLHPGEVVLPLRDTRVRDLLGQALADAQARLTGLGVPTVTGTGDIQVRVFLGTRELTDLVRVEIDEHNRDLKARITAGGRR